MKFCPDCGIELPDRKTDEERRSAACDKGEACGAVEWQNPTPVVCAVIEYQGKVLLAHNRKWPKKFFGLITGFLEKAEIPEEAVLREVEEETGLVGRVQDFLGLRSFAMMNQLLIGYHVVVDEGTIQLNEELDDYKLVAVEKLQPWPMGTGDFVKEFLRRQNAAESVQD